MWKKFIRRKDGGNKQLILKGELEQNLMGYEEMVLIKLEVRSQSMVNVLFKIYELFMSGRYVNCFGPLMEKKLLFVLSRLVNNFYDLISCTVLRTTVMNPFPVPGSIRIDIKSSIYRYIDQWQIYAGSEVSSPSGDG
jgi:hypothetical protein